jgi:hypothetical protein
MTSRMVSTENTSPRIRVRSIAARSSRSVASAGRQSSRVRQRSSGGGGEFRRS